MDKMNQLILLIVFTIILYSTMAWGITEHKFGMGTIGIAILILFAAGIFVGKVIFESDK